MREIKFRAWDGNKMHYPTEIQCGSNCFSGRPAISFPINGGSCITEFGGEWTGLRDKNGKEIYEGDIVRIVGEPSYAAMWQIVFQRGAFKLSDGLGFRYMDSVFRNASDCEVVGNVFENGELSGTTAA